MQPAIFARETPDKAAVIMASGQTISYRALDQRSNQCAPLYAQLGLAPGDAIALFMTNCADYFYAGQWVNAIEESLASPPEE